MDTWTPDVVFAKQLTLDTPLGEKLRAEKTAPIVEAPPPPVEEEPDPDIFGFYSNAKKRKRNETVAKLPPTGTLIPKRQRATVRGKEMRSLIYVRNTPALIAISLAQSPLNWTLTKNGNTASTNLPIYVYPVRVGVLSSIDVKLGPIAGVRLNGLLEWAVQMVSTVSALSSFSPHTKSCINTNRRAKLWRTLCERFPLVTLPFFCYDKSDRSSNDNDAFGAARELIVPLEVIPFFIQVVIEEIPALYTRAIPLEASVVENICAQFRAIGDSWEVNCKAFVATTSYFAYKIIVKKQWPIFIANAARWKQTRGMEMLCVSEQLPLFKGIGAMQIRYSGLPETGARLIDQKLRAIYFPEVAGNDMLSTLPLVMREETA